MSSSNKQLIPILDMFRLAAALLVALVHYEILFGDFVIYGAFATTALSWFFVLSGFILAYNYSDLAGAEHYKKYFRHRLIRIYPTYFLAVMVSGLLVSIGYTVLGEAYFAEVRRPFEVSYDLPEVKDNAFWLMAMLRHLSFTQSVGSIETLNLVFNGPLWSLVLEVYFYICFPLLIVLIRPIKTMTQIIAALVLGYLLQYLLILTFLPQADSYDVMNLNRPVYTNPLIRGLEFIFGMLLYKAYALLPAPEAAGRLRLWPVILACLFYVLTIVLSENFVPYQYRMYFSAVPAVVLLVWTLARTPWYPEGRARRFCLWCGGMSYVLYCFHWPLMEMIQLWDLLPPTLPFAVHLPLTVGILLLVCHIIYRFIETPVRKYCYRRFDS